MAFDVPALTRGISGLFTADEERKQKEQERAREQQRQVMADLLSKRRVEEFEASGRARREQQAAAAEARKLRAAEVEAGQQQRADFILNQLGAEDLEGIEGFEGQGLPDQLKTLETALRRQRTRADRVPRSTTAPKPFAQDARVRRVVNLYSQLADEGLNPKSDPLSNLRATGSLEPPPVDSAGVRQRAMLEATNRFRHEFTEEELPELTTILDGVVSEKEDKPEPSVADIEQMIRALNAQGLSPEEIQTRLAQQGINVRL